MQSAKPTSGVEGMVFLLLTTTTPLVELEVFSVPCVIQVWGTSRINIAQFRRRLIIFRNENGVLGDYFHGALVAGSAPIGIVIEVAIFH